MSFLEKIFRPESVRAKEKTDGTRSDSMEAQREEQTVSDDEAVETIRASLLFDEAWYREKYGFGEYLDAAKHYLEQGWKEGREPSAFFSNEEYLSLYPDVRESGINPLLHFELYGVGEGRYGEQITERRQQIADANPDCCSDLEGGFLRIRITNACNAKCRYCGLRNSSAEQSYAMDPKWYYEYFKPLYDKVDMVLITGGDAFVARESYNYMKFMSEKYPSITLMTESNGIAFDEKFRRIAAANLFKTHFSVNASTPEVFAKSCWEGTGGEAIYPRLMSNIEAYIDILREQGKICFAPSMSMVVNHDNYKDIQNFTRMALRHHAWYICFYFDYSENNMNDDYFSRPDEMRPVLKEMMEIERVLAGRVTFYFRLWIPRKEVDLLQCEVEAEPISKLQKKYSDLLELSEGRSLQDEFSARNEWRRRSGKRELNIQEDISPSLRVVERGERQVCFAPWGELDFYPEGRMDFCGWFERTLDLHEFLRDDSIDWKAVINSYEYMAARKRILHGNFRGCMLCCPMNGANKDVVSIHQYGSNRLMFR